MNSESISFTMFVIFIFLLIKNGVGFEDYNTDVIRILDEIKNEDLFIPHGE